ncbi:NAD(P)-dependent oxidoreductase [Mesorhizobium marinum]
MPSLEALLAISDVVSLHTPLSPETKHMMNAETLAQMKPGSVLINTGRGGCVDLAALTDALMSGHVAAAGLDVLEAEPPAAASALMAAWRADGSPIRDRLIVTPHAAFYSPSSLIDLRSKSAATALNYLLTGDSRDCANRDFLDLAKAGARAAAARA